MRILNGLTRLHVNGNEIEQETSEQLLRKDRDQTKHSGTVYLKYYVVYAISIPTTQCINRANVTKYSII